MNWWAFVLATLLVIFGGIIIGKYIPGIEQPMIFILTVLWGLICYIGCLFLRDLH